MNVAADNIYSEFMKCTEGLPGTAKAFACPGSGAEGSEVYRR